MFTQHFEKNSLMTLGYFRETLIFRSLSINQTFNSSIQGVCLQHTEIKLVYYDYFLFDYDVLYVKFLMKQGNYFVIHKIKYQTGIVIICFIRHWNVLSFFLRSSLYTLSLCLCLSFMFIWLYKLIKMGVN